MLNVYYIYSKPYLFKTDSLLLGRQTFTLETDFCMGDRPKRQTFTWKTAFYFGDRLLLERQLFSWETDLYLQSAKYLMLLPKNEKNNATS